MRKALILVPVVVATTATLATVAAARPVSANQRVTIEQKGDSFQLTSTSGAVRRDAGTFAACCWTSRQVVRVGRQLDVNDPHLTLTGRRGILKLRNRVVWVDLPGGWATFTGTWKVVGGTAGYAGLSGHGIVEGVQTAGGSNRATFFGFLTPK